MSIQSNISNGSKNSNELEKDSEDKHLKYARIAAQIASNSRFDEVIRKYGCHGAISLFYHHFYPEGELKK